LLAWSCLPSLPAACLPLVKRAASILCSPGAVRNRKCSGMEWNQVCCAPAALMWSCRPELACTVLCSSTRYAVSVLQPRCLLCLCVVDPIISTAVLDVAGSVVLKDQPFSPLSPSPTLSDHILTVTLRCPQGGSRKNICRNSSAMLAVETLPPISKSDCLREIEPLTRLDSRQR
jgi:hypothetical protein